MIPRLVAIIKEYPENDPLINVCLLALCNLADIGETSRGERGGGLWGAWLGLRAVTRWSGVRFTVEAEHWHLLSCLILTF